MALSTLRSLAASWHCFMAFSYVSRSIGLSTAPTSLPYPWKSTETPISSNGQQHTHKQCRESAPIYVTSSPYVCKVAGCIAPLFQMKYLLGSHANVHSSVTPCYYCLAEGCPHAEGGKGFKRADAIVPCSIAESNSRDTGDNNRRTTIGGRRRAKAGLRRGNPLSSTRTQKH